MADVLLRDCVEELRSNIRAGHYSTAFALGQHILRYFPKHIETYNLLAEASFETDDLASANDLFRRVLSADPENVIALAGMAQLSEAQEKYDDALWYLERANEIQPANDDLRRELLRASEAYYGTTPTRLELTPGALARVYARQGQYTQAVDEFRRLLRNDGKRFDVRVALAEALYRLGRHDEAAEVAQAVMADAPYALKPNLILGLLWTENAVPGGEQFLSRAQTIDPESRVARELVSERGLLTIGQAEPPRLPAYGERSIPARDTLASFGAEDGAPATNLLRELDTSPLELEPASTERLFDELDALSLVETESPVAEALTLPETEREQAPGTAAAMALGMAAASTLARTSPETSDEPLQGQAVSPDAETPDATHPTMASPGAIAPVTRTPHAKEIPTDAIALASATLATSIALDKSNQPSPTRRAYLVIPKVRPVIRSAQEKLPAWLRISATPAQAPASFEPTPPTTADQVAPISTFPPVQERAAWPAQAKVAAQEPSADAAHPTDEELPDWLRAAATAQVVEHSTKVEPAPQPTGPNLPDRMSDETTVVHPGPTTPPSASVVAAPEWLSDDTTREPIVEAPSTETTDQQMVGASSAETIDEVAGWTSEPEQATGEPVYQSAIEHEPPPVRARAPIEGETESVEPPTPEPTVPVQETLERAEPAIVLANQVAPSQVPQPEPVAPTPVMPDSATMLAMARKKRASGDLMGALDLYERVMHRRPNYLDEIIKDLQEITGAEGAPNTAHRLLGEAFAMAGR